MAQKSLQETEEKNEEKKILTKQLNKFLSDYFNWIVAGIMAAIFVSGFFVLLLPKYQQAVNYINITNQQQISNASSKQDELNKIQQLLAAYNGIDKKSIDEINAIAPQVQNKEELFSQLNYLVAANQLFLQSISLSTVDNYDDQGLVPLTGTQSSLGADFQTVRISLSVEGTNYQAFKNLLSSLENNLRLMDVLTIDFSPQSQTTSLVINTYYSKN